MTDLTALGLPTTIRACLFDLDGVLTPTAKIHAAAWKQMFDGFLRQREGADAHPFDPVGDYDAYVDGRPRADGVRTFLAARGISLPEGHDDDPPDQQPGQETVQGLGNRKNLLVLDAIRRQGVQPYPGSVRYVDAVRAAGLATAVVSSSTNCRDVLAAAGIADRFDTVVDGHTAQERKLPGKPHPDTFLAAAEDLGVPAGQAAVFEDALAGMDAGRSGGFGRVVGVDRVGQQQDLLAHGADTVVTDLAQLLESER